MNKSEILALCNEGVTFHAAVAGNDGWPENFQCFGCSVSEDGRILRLLCSKRIFPAMQSLAPGKRIAITYSQPVTMKTAQVKGLILETKPVSEEDLGLFEAWHKKICFEYAAVGVAVEAVAALSMEPDTVLECELDSYFAQTPGPRAGERV